MEECEEPGPGSDRNSDPNPDLQQDVNKNTKPSTEADDIKLCQIGFTNQRNNKESWSEKGPKAEKKLFSCSADEAEMKPVGRQSIQQQPNVTDIKTTADVSESDQGCNSDKNTCHQCGELFSHRKSLSQHVAFHMGGQTGGKQDNPEPLSIKEEQEEAEIFMFTFIPEFIKNEDDEEKPPFSQFHQSHTEEDTEDSGEQEPEPKLVRISDVGGHFQPSTDEENSESSDPETDDSDDWREPQLALNNKASVCGSEDKLLSCSDCGKQFKRMGHLNIHKRIHTGEKPFSCTVCGKRFTQKGNLTQHMRLHTGEKLFSCTVCNKKFSWHHQPKKHKCVSESQLHQSQTETKEAEPPGSSLDLRSYLQPEVTVSWEENSDAEIGLNMLINKDGSVNCISSKKLFSCSECGKGFDFRVHLQSHMRTHTGEKPFDCSECGKRFGFRKYLQTHMRTHTGEKPYGCSVCRKGFTQKGTLTLHMRLHTGEKPFSCSVCNKQFGFQKYLRTHMRSHTGEKPFCCTECGKRFTEKGNMTRHMRSHTGEKRFSCGVCNERFSWHSQLKRHTCQ